MYKIVINGGNELSGNIQISGAKNASLPIIISSILPNRGLYLTNVPDISDIKFVQKLIKSYGVNISSIESSNGFELSIDSSNITNITAPYEIISKMRASVWVLAPLLVRFGEAKVSLPGGCAIGVRAINFHIDLLRAMGAKIDISEGYINAKVKGNLKGCHFKFPIPSVGGTITGILAGVLADGQTVLSNAALEPEIIDLCNCLVKLGAKISGIGSSQIIIDGVSSLGSAKHRIIPDRIEAGTYAICAAVAGGDVTLSGINHVVLENLINPLLEIGVNVICDGGVNVIKQNQVKNQVDQNSAELRGDVQSDNDEGAGCASVIVDDINEGSIRILSKRDQKLNPINIETDYYPGFSTDFQAQLMVLLTKASGISTITEKIFENRFMHVSELGRMGAKIDVRQNKATIYGGSVLTGCDVMASDLRASSSLVIAALFAKGQTRIHRVYHLDRGYSAIEKKLSACGADIMRVEDV